ncbi:hypothetical protein ACWFRQ_36860 [Streptomyces niveus]
MLKCTAVTLLPPPDYITDQATSERPANAAYVSCELGEHDDDHAQLLWMEDERGGAVWSRWNADGTRIEFLPWCGVYRPDRDEACGLFATHPAGHSFDVVDPVREALRDLLSGVSPHVFLSDNRPPLLPGQGDPESPSTPALAVWWRRPPDDVVGNP